MRSETKKTNMPKYAVDIIQKNQENIIYSSLIKTTSA